MRTELEDAWNAQGLALLAYWKGDKSAFLKVKDEDEEVIQLPVSIYFREKNELPPLESYALSLCSGKILDVGAGAGAHSLILEKRGLSTTALDIEEATVTIMKERGLKQAVCGDFLGTTKDQCYDTLLFLMNGIGISGDLKGLEKHLRHAYDITSDQGQLLLDSSELEVERSKAICYRLGFKEQWGPAYKWLYVCKKDLIEIARKTSWLAQIIYEEDDGSYLARLIKVP